VSAAEAAAACMRLYGVPCLSVFQMSGRALNVRLDVGPQEASGELAAKRAATDMSAYGGGMGGMAGRWWAEGLAGGTGVQ